MFSALSTGRQATNGATPEAIISYVRCAAEEQDKDPTYMLKWDMKEFGLFCAQQLGCFYLVGNSAI